MIEIADLNAVQLEEYRLGMRKRAINSLAFLCKYILDYQDVDSPYHKRMCKRYQNTYNKPFVLELHPRGHLKTSVITVGGTIWQIIQPKNKLGNDKTVRGVDLRYLIGGASYDVSIDMLKDIKSVFETNEMFRWMFPELAPDDRWIAGRGAGIWCAERLDIPGSRWCRRKEGTINVTSVGGSKVSKHFDDINIDDGINDDNSESRDVRAKVSKWFKNLLPLRNDGSTSRIRLVGTRWHYGDRYGEIIKQEKARKEEAESNGKVYFPVWDIYHSGAVKNGEPVWKEKYTLEILSDIKAEIGSYLYSCHYDNEPVSLENAQFKEEDIKEIDKEDLPVNLTYYAALDQADEETTFGDYTVLTIAGFDFMGKMYVVDIKRGKFTQNEIILMCMLATKRYKLKKLGVETTGFQKTLLRGYKHATRKHKIFVPWTEISRGNSSKIKLHLGLQPRVERGDFYYVKGIKDAEEMINEMIQMPKGEHDDILDTLAFIDAIHIKDYLATENEKPLENYNGPEQISLDYFGDIFSMGDDDGIIRCG
jgi:phage terminase large subunit-like protein